MEMAVAIVERGETSVRRAAEIYNVPRSTLHDRVSGKIRIDSKPGKKPYLSVEEERGRACFFFPQMCKDWVFSHTKGSIGNCSTYSREQRYTPCR